MQEQKQSDTKLTGITIIYCLSKTLQVLNTLGVENMFKDFRTIHLL